MTHKILFPLIALSTINLYGMKAGANHTFVVEPQKIANYVNETREISKSIGEATTTLEDYLKFITSDKDAKQKHRSPYVTNFSTFLTKKNSVYQNYLVGQPDGVKIYVQEPSTNALLVNISGLLPIVKELEKPHVKALLIENLLLSSEIDGLKQTLETLKKQFEPK